MSDINNINTTPPPDRIAPIGQNSPPPYTSTASTQPTASIVTLQSQITNVTAAIATLQASIAQTLDGLALPVTTVDTTLAAAVQSTWPTSLGTPPNYVTYNYYNYLLNQNNSAATLITQAYQTAMQDVGGNDGIDLLPILQILSNEISYINDFINNNLTGPLSDSSEQRTVELFQSLLISANTQVQNAQNIFQGQGSFLSTTETGLLSQGDSQNAQALFQVNLNKLNETLNQDIQALNINFATSANVFYTQFLEPALQFRQNVSSQVLPIYPGVLGAVLNSSVSAANQDLNDTLLDQQNRINFLATQVDQIMTDIINRDSFRNYVLQLENQGVPAPSGVSGQIIAATDSPAAATFFQNYATTTSIVSLATATPSFTADHNELDNLTSLSAHPQYAPLDSPNFTGTPTAPTQPAGDNTSAIATDEFVQTAINSIVISGGGETIDFSIGLTEVDTTDPSVRTISVDFGTAAGTVTEGNDPRIAGALQASNNLSDLVNTAEARINLGLGTAATDSASAFDAAGTAATLISELPPTQQWVVNVQPTTSPNGSTTIFTTPSAYVSGSLVVMLNGLTEFYISELTNTTFSFSTAPYTGDIITMIYRTN